ISRHPPGARSSEQFPDEPLARMQSWSDIRVSSVVPTEIGHDKHGNGKATRPQAGPRLDTSKAQQRMTRYQKNRHVEHKPGCPSQPTAEWHPGRQWMQELAWGQSAACPV